MLRCMSRCLSRGFACWLLLLPVAARAEVDMRGEVLQLFQQGEKYSASALATVEEHYQQLRSTTRDPRWDYAYLLMLIKQHDNDNALRVAAALAESAADPLPAYRAKVWLEMNKKKYAAAMADMDLLSQRLPKADGAGEAEAGPRDASRFIGRMLGFLEGPAAEAVNQSTREELRIKIIDRLTPSRRQAMDDARRAVVKRFSELDLKEEQVKTDAKVEEQQEKEQLRDQVEKDKAAVGQQQSDLAEKAAKLRADLDRELDQFDAVIRPLTSQLARLEAVAGTNNRQLSFAQAQIADLFVQLQNENDQNRRFAINAQINSINNQADALRRNLASVNSEAAGLVAQRNALQAKRNGVVARGQDALSQLDRDGAGLRREEGKLRNDEKRAKSPATGVTSRSRSMSAKIAAFTTYEEFPIEQEKQRLLDSFGAK